MNRKAFLGLGSVAAVSGYAVTRIGKTEAPPLANNPPGNDTMIAALEAIAHPRGNHKLPRTEAVA